MDLVFHTLLIGIGATVLTDAWAFARARLLKLPAPDFGLLGRWLGHMPRGRFRHASIAAAAPVRGEVLVGWITHYLVGVMFATLLVVIVGPAWVAEPSPWPALAVGLGTVAAPWLLMQPAMGAGFAASRTPRPAATRLQNLVTHFVFGLGLYLAGLACRLLPIA